LRHDGVTKLASSPDGKSLASTSLNEVKVWDVVDGKLLFTSHFPNNLDDVAYSTSGDQIIAASRAGVKVLDAKSGKELSPRGDTSTGQFAKRMEEGSLVASFQGDQFVRISNTRTGEQLHSFNTRREVYLWGPALDRNGKRLATSSPGGIVSLWEVTTGQEVLSLTMTSPIRQGGGPILFTADGERLVVAHGGIIEIWSAGPSSTEWETTRGPVIKFSIPRAG
jgi:WD40 repeat protein